MPLSPWLELNQLLGEDGRGFGRHNGKANGTPAISVKNSVVATVSISPSISANVSLMPPIRSGKLKRLTVRMKPSRK
jgi:hypothetical protein